MIWWLLACTGQDPRPNQLVGRTWTHGDSGAALRVPAGWRLATEPEHFVSGLPHVVLEGRHADGTSLAVAFLRVPEALETQAGPLSPLDALSWVAPAPEELQTHPSWRLERLPDCGGAIARGWDLQGAMIQHALRVPDGLLLLQAWRDDGAWPTVLEPLTCGVG